MIVTPTKGRTNKIAIVGEAPGEHEASTGAPFMGKAGQELTSMLAQAGIARQDVYLTNVFHERPPDNDLTQWCVPKKEILSLDKDYAYPAITPGKYLRPEYTDAVARLYSELHALRPLPNVVVALGNTAVWALLGRTGITKLRGALTMDQRNKYKVLPTYHPAGVLRNWDWRTITILDLIKARLDSDYPEIQRKRREVWVPDTGAEAVDWWNTYKSDEIVIDTETYHGGYCHTFGIGTSPERALVMDLQHMTGTVAAWSLIWDIMNDRSIRKIFQNCLYDMQILWKRHGIPTFGPVEDTMLIHHAIQPELPKGLGFLGSIYCNEPAWKVTRSKHIETTKREDD